MNTSFLIATLPLLAILASLYYLMKKPQRMRNLSMALTMPLFGFFILAYFGTGLSPDKSGLFNITFGILCIYCVTMVPAIMHLSSAIRQRKKMARQDAQQNSQQQNAQQQ